MPRTKGVTPRDLFLFLSQKLRAIVRHDGFDFRVFVNLTLPYFATLTPALQEKAIWHIHTLIEVCKSLQTQGLALNDSRVMIPVFLKLNGLQAPTDTLAALNPTDLVDIYDDHGNLAFVSLAFLCAPHAYSLEEVFCRPWGELYGRTTPYLANEYFELANSILSGECSGPVNTAAISNTQGLALAAQKGLPILLLPQTLSPIITSDCKVAGYLAVNRLELIK